MNSEFTQVSIRHGSVQPPQHFPNFVAQTLELQTMPFLSEAHASSPCVDSRAHRADKWPGPSLHSAGFCCSDGPQATPRQPGSCASQMNHNLMYSVEKDNKIDAYKTI